MEIGIVDIGTARLKASCWRFEGNGFPKAVWWSQRDTGDAAENGDFAEVESKLRGLVADTRTRSAVVVACGGKLLRDPAWHGLAVVAEELADRCFVLAADEEAKLLLRSALRNTTSAKSVLADIGGGSVQAVRGQSIGAAESLSWPIGTYAIQARFGLSVGASEGSYEKVAKVLRQELSDGGLQWSAVELVIGSNVMETFMRRLSSRIGASGAGPWTLSDLDNAWRYCSQVPQELFSEVFPENPGFMGGADKAMLIAWVIAGLLDVKQVRGTNASVSEGLALVAADAIRLGHEASDMTIA